MTAFLETFTAAFILGALLVRANLALVRRLSLGQRVRDDAPGTHRAKAGTPTMGGAGMFLAAAAAAALTGGVASPRARAVAAAAALCFLLGLADDLIKVLAPRENTAGRGDTAGLKARYRFAVQLLIGASLCAAIQGSLFGIPLGVDLGIREPAMQWLPLKWGGWALGVWFIPFGAAVFAGTVNAVNFTDGLDGLLAGCFLAAAGAFVFFASRYGDASLVPLLAAAMGAAAAFLWFNAHPARIFMGDSGSLFLGGVLAATALVTRASLFLFVVGLVFVAEAASVMLQVACFRLTGRRVFRMSPLHHHFELSGWSEPHVVTRFWLAAVFFAACGLLLFVR
ncbi:MAG: phospho-N-acetylmuramoyl-pentapeptide-transferase [bacterium]